MESDQRYYSRRAAEERRAAMRAITEEARERHRTLADLFSRRADRASSAEEADRLVG